MKHSNPKKYVCVYSFIKIYESRSERDLKSCQVINSDKSHLLKKVDLLLKRVSKL